jgi:hypothetical protein
LSQIKRSQPTSEKFITFIGPSLIRVSIGLAAFGKLDISVSVQGAVITAATAGVRQLVLLPSKIFLTLLSTHNHHKPLDSKVRPQLIDVTPIMISNNLVLIKSLTYLGALPFFLAVYIEFSHQLFLGFYGSEWFLTYGLVILSFMAGTLWGQVVNERINAKRIALSANAVTLAAWFAFLLTESSTALITMALGFAALCMLEAFVMTHIKRPLYYLGLRLRVTALVVLAHGVMFCLV